jgi:nucleotide-binding universal stress UspA family protein
MVKFLVCVDGSQVSFMAFRDTMNLAKPTDTVLVVHCVEDVRQRYLQNMTFMPEIGVQNFSDSQNQINLEGRRLLEGFIARAKRMGRNDVVGVLGVTISEGEFICRLAKSRGCDFVVLGRRGLSGLKRWFVGSTSKYVMEHCEANVIVVKHDEPTTQATQKGVDEVHAEQQRAREYIGDIPQERSKVDPTIALEEMERQRRIEEEKSIMTREENERAATLLQVHKAEEKERQRRIREEGIKEERTFHVQIYDIGGAPFTPAKKGIATTPVATTV